jgi:adenylate cyclase
MWSTDDERSTVTMLRTVGFADLVGYSSAAASMSVGELANALLDFDERCATIVVQHNGQLVKTIGDEVMFVTEEAIDACRIATALVRSFGQGDLPPVRVGLAAGDVVSVLGDVYGPVVNLAARLVGAADPSTVVVSESVHAAVDRVMPLSAIGPLTLKGFSDPVAAYRITDDH